MRLVLALLATACARPTVRESATSLSTTASYNIIKRRRGLPVVVDFYSDSCVLVG